MEEKNFLIIFRVMEDDCKNRKECSIEKEFVFEIELFIIFSTLDAEIRNIFVLIYK